MTTLHVLVPIDEAFLALPEAEETVRALAYQAALSVAGRPVTGLEEVRREPLFPGSPCIAIEFTCQPMAD